MGKAHTRTLRAARPSTPWSLLAVVASISCASATQPLPATLPPITAQPTRTVTAGKFVWMDLVTQDVERAKEFYGALFEWTFEPGDGYTQVMLGRSPIAGIVAARDPERGSEWVGSLSVEDVDVAAKRASELGGVVERGPLDAPNRGRMAAVSDPEGALLLLLRGHLLLRRLLLLLGLGLGLGLVPAALGPAPQGPGRRPDRRALAGVIVCDLADDGSCRSTACGPADT